MLLYTFCMLSLSLLIPRAHIYRQLQSLHHALYISVGYSLTKGISSRTLSCKLNQYTTVILYTLSGGKKGTDIDLAVWTYAGADPEWLMGWLATPLHLSISESVADTV